MLLVEFRFGFRKWCLTFKTFPVFLKLKLFTKFEQIYGATKTPVTPHLDQLYVDDSYNKLWRSKSPKPVCQ